MTYIQIYIYTDILFCRYTYIHICIYIYIYIYQYIYIYIYKYTYLQMYIYTNIHIYKCTYIQIYIYTDLQIYIYIHTHVVLSKSCIAMAHSFHGNVWKIARGYSWQKHPPVPPSRILPGHPPLLRHAEPLLVGSTLAPWSDAQPQPDAATGFELLESWRGDRVGPRWPVLQDLL